MADEQATQKGERDLLGAYAGFVSRLIAFVIDLLVVTATITTITIVGNFVLDALDNMFGFIPAEAVTSWVMVTIISIVSLGFYLIYFIGLWMMAGQTLGKWVVGVRIVRTNGERMTFRTAVVRLVGYWISAILFLGYLWVLVDNRRQGLHDKLAGTFVVYSWPEDPKHTEILQKRAQRFRERRSSRSQS
jgi:uncharacterized RDD family membrane protein YckC